VKSAAANRAVYLRRPDLGRQLNLESRERLERWRLERAARVGLAICFADGLSSVAIERHAVPLLDALLPLLNESEGWEPSPVVIAQQARVALGDEIGEVLRAELLLMLIGERPGLSSPDSMGAYITWNPKHGRTDAERNCVSNIRPEGLGYARAAQKLAAYLCESRRLRLSGVSLKEDHQLLSDGR
jgi:ethanolamine ammonia-lyase small subunit